jgi:hypothetical protein
VARARFAPLHLPLAGLALLAGCGAGRSQRPPTVARAWEIGDRVLTAAVWGPDSVMLDRALERAADSVRGGGGGVTARAGAGAALDRAALALRAAADSAVLDFGGLYLFIRGAREQGSGKGNPGREVGIPDPDDAFRMIAVLTLPDTPAVLAVGTVSQTERARGNAAKSATVLARTGRDAEAWSVSFLALGCVRAVAAAGRVGVGVVCVDERGKVHWSPDLDGRVTAAATDSTGPSPAPAPAPGPAPGRAAERRESRNRS